MAQASSGTYSFRPAAVDMVLESFSRIQVRPTSITQMHMRDAGMSANLLQSEWSVRNGPNLWEITLFSIPLVQGVTSYGVPGNIVAILDYYLRQGLTGATRSGSPAFSTTAGSPAITINLANHGLSPGDAVSILIPVSIGGIIVFGGYSVATVIDPNDFTIIANQSATVTASGGAVPQFTTTLNSSSVRVTLSNHGLVTNQNFAIQVATSVGGLVLSGSYIVTSVVDQNNFTISGGSAATSGATAFENGGLAQIQTIVATPSLTDIVLQPISRSEYAAQPNKAQQARPTCVWWDRAPATGGTTATLWPVPDGNGPYLLQFYAMTQPMDVVIAGGGALDIPYRFLDAFAAGLAAKLARKYPPAPPITVNDLKMESEQAWMLASGQDVENVPLFISPGLGGYYRQ